MMAAAITNESIYANRCYICDWRAPQGLGICRWCWNEYKEYIQEKSAWLRYMHTYGTSERRWQKKSITNLSIDLVKEWEDKFIGFWKQKESLGQ